MWLRACRYSLNDEDCLRGLSRVRDLTFLLGHKYELNTYWQPRFMLLDEEEEYEENDGRWDAWT
jgi:hypothetical protein